MKELVAQVKLPADAEAYRCQPAITGKHICKYYQTYLLQNNLAKNTVFWTAKNICCKIIWEIMPKIFVENAAKNIVFKTICK